MTIKKTLALLGTITATGLAGAATLALAYAPQAQGIRDRLRGAYDDLVRHVMGGKKPSTEVVIPTETESEVARATEHTIEHGAEGRARAAGRNRKPHVASAMPTVSLHPSHTRRHA